MPKHFPHEFPERPFDCGECKKPIYVIYTEIIGNSVTKTSMCADCPELERRLYGAKLTKGIEGVIHEHETGLCCGNCGTTLESVKKGNPFGCMDCYEVFGDVIINEMLTMKKMPFSKKSKKNVPLHIGRALGESSQIDPSVRLLALNEALKETLSREDYEQAAWLRDQIKELTGNSDDKKLES